jgi:L-arabinokinase
VAVFGYQEALDEEVPRIVEEYKRLTGLEVDIFKGSSPGAKEFGALRYSFGPMGWYRSI